MPPRTARVNQSAETELQWLRLHVLMTEDRAPRDAVEGFARAMIERNGAAARVFLAPSIRDRIPPGSVGLSHPHLAQYKILDEQKVDDQTYRFQVRFDTDEATGIPLVPGPVGTYTVRDVPGDPGGNRSWLITDMPTER
jgi:hypothetical protein